MQILFGLKLLDALKKNVTNDSNALRADLIERIVYCVPVRNLKVDYIYRRNAAFQEYDVVIYSRGRLIHKDIRVAEARRG